MSFDPSELIRSLAYVTEDLSYASEAGHFMFISVRNDKYTFDAVHLNPHNRDWNGY